MRIAVAVLRERLVRLADQERKLREFDRMQSEVVALRRERHVDGPRLARSRRNARLHPHPERKLSAKTYNVTALKPHGLIAHCYAIHLPAVLAAHYGLLPSAVF